MRSCAGCGRGDKVKAVWSGILYWQKEQLDLCWTCDWRVTFQLLPLLRQLEPQPKWSVGLAGGCRNCERGAFGSRGHDYLSYHHIPGKEMFRLCLTCAPGLLVTLPLLQHPWDREDGMPL